MISSLKVVIPAYAGMTYGPKLVSTREFGYWMENNFADTNPEFYLAATHIKNEEGFPKHPGAYLNGFFRKHPMINIQKAQRSFHIESEFILGCIKEGIVSLKDANKLVGDENTNYSFIKFYTLDQLQIALDPLIKLFRPGFEKVAGNTRTVVIDCSQRPEWHYDTNLKQRPAPLIGLKTDKKESITVKPKRSQYKGLAGIKIRDNNMWVNLYRDNWDGRNWEYVNIQHLVGPGVLLINQGDMEWHTAKVTKRGEFVIKNHLLATNTPPGKYELEFINSTGTYRINLKNQITGA